jgi:hypothetical protein
MDDEKRITLKDPAAATDVKAHPRAARRAAHRPAAALHTSELTGDERAFSTA